jgi:hypothetical protein
MDGRAPAGRRADGRALLAAAFALTLAITAPPARASYEEFSTYDIGRQEADDENLLDHVLVRPPIEWRDEWQRSRNGFRTSQGCFTSGKWYLDHQLRVRVPMSDSTRFDIEMRDVADDESFYGWTSLEFRFPIPRTGMWGFRFRPSFDKSRQDAALLWDAGHAGTPLQASVAFTLEDIFNKLWTARQTQVGDESQPFERHPFEPALAFAWRGPDQGVSLSGKWLTPSIKRFDTRDSTLRRRERLWGVKHDVELWRRFGATRALLAFEQTQTSSWAEWQTVAGDHHLYRRRWRLEGALTRTVGQRGEVGVRFFYQERDQVWRPPHSNSALGIIDRMPVLEGAFQVPWAMRARVGLMRNRVTISEAGWLPLSNHGTRVETRAVLALQRRFGRLLVQLTEGLELDSESYDVLFIHDKGFFHIQTTF